MSLGNLGTQINHQKTNKPFISFDNAYGTHCSDVAQCCRAHECTFENIGGMWRHVIDWDWR